MRPDPARAIGCLKPSVRGAERYTLEAQAARRKLNQNEAPWGPPPDLQREILERAARLPWNRYPPFAPAALQRRLAERHGWSADGVLVGNGSNEVLQAAVTASVRQGDAVVAPSPTFSLYRLLAAANEGRYLAVPLGADFTYDVDQIVSAARREHARAVVLCSPNNPTGSVLPEGAVERLLGETEALILCDEAYQDFGGPTAIPLLHRSARLLVFRTFSKAMGLAGLRFGYALGHPDLVREVSKVMLPYNVNLLTLAAAEVVLEHAPRFAERIGALVAERDRFLAGLRGIPGLTAWPSSGNFVLLRCESRPGAEIFRRLRDEHGILVRDVSSAPALADCLRVSIGATEDMQATLAALRILFTSREA